MLKLFRAQIKAKWYEALSNILKNAEKDADLFRLWNFWSFRGIRCKIQVFHRFQRLTLHEKS
tara:strand:- start:345 stop:530 length:186 start_codon:yes stop_codon:yes gene_type:complete